MRASTQHSRSLRVLARRTGVIKIPLARRAADFLKRTLFAYHPPFALPIQGFWLKGFGLWQYITGTYEPETTAYFNQTIQPRWTAVDVGADFGYFTLLFARLVGQGGRVFAFEPSKERRDNYLSDNIIRNNDHDIATVYPFGLSDTTSVREYFEDTHSFYSHANTAATEQKQVHAFDDVFARHGGTVDIVKIDVEGHELAVLRGMQHTIQHNQDIRIVFEVAPHLLRNAGSSPDALFNLLQSFGMWFFWLEEDGTETPVSRGELASRLAKVKYTNVLCHR